VCSRFEEGALGSVRGRPEPTPNGEAVATPFTGVDAPGGVVCDLSPCATADDVVVRLFPVLRSVGPHVGRDPILLAKLARIARHQLEEVRGGCRPARSIVAS